MEWFKKLTQHPVVAHWLRAFQRYGQRLGAQFAAAITYFSVLSMVPILMVAFAALGLTVTVFFPDVLEALKQAITDAVSGQETLSQQITALVDQAFSSWQAVGIIGLLSALWSGQAWVNNVRAAVRAQLRRDFDSPAPERNIVVRTLQNIAILFGFLLLLALTAATSTIATAARGLVRSLLSLPDTAATAWMLSLIPLVGTLVAGFLLFAFVFRVFPSRKVPTRTWLLASAIGSVGMAILQYATALLIGVFNNNPAAAVFGSVIVLMLFFNLFATLILLTAAWIGTAPREPDATEKAVDIAASAVRTAPTDYATKVLAARLADDTETVPTQVAVRATRVGLGLGAAAGATLAGLAAAAAALLSGRRPG